MRFFLVILSNKNSMFFGCSWICEILICLNFVIVVLYCLRSLKDGARFKRVKSDSKIIIDFCYSKSLTNSERWPAKFRCFCTGFFVSNHCVSISSTFYGWIFHTKVLWQLFSSYILALFCFLAQKKIGAKGERKMLMKLTPRAIFSWKSLKMKSLAAKTCFGSIIVLFHYFPSHKCWKMSLTFIMSFSLSLRQKMEENILFLILFYIL